MPGQTLSEIRSLLAAAGLAPRHRLGQNFLVDLNLMRKLVAAAEVGPGDVVLEVGCGTGSLTEILLDAGARVIGVEIDRGLQGILTQRLGDNRQFTLVSSDALARKNDVSPEILDLLLRTAPERGGGRKLVANLPYQIATPLIMELLCAHEQRSQPSRDREEAVDQRSAPLPHGRGSDRAPLLGRMTCTIQKEVGERLMARPSTGEYGPVSVVTQTLADAEIVAMLPASVFWPRPRIESVMIDLRPRPIEQTDVDDIRDFVQFVRRAFTQRRKTLRRLAKAWPVDEIEAVLSACGLSPDARPEELSPSDWRALHRAARRARQR